MIVAAPCPLCKTPAMLRLFIALGLLVLAPAVARAEIDLVDPTFGMGGMLASSPRLYPLESGGYLLVDENEWAQRGYQRFDHRGRRIDSFGQSGSVAAVEAETWITTPWGNWPWPRPLLRAAGEDALGRIIVASRDADIYPQEESRFEEVGDPMLLVAARLGPDGSLDTAFGDNGFLKVKRRPFRAGDPCRGEMSLDSVLYAPGGATYLVGNSVYEEDPGSPLWQCAVMLKVDARGRLDPRFRNAGVAQFPVQKRATVFGAKLEPDGSILLTGLSNDASSPVPSHRSDYDGVNNFFRLRVGASGKATRPQLRRTPTLPAWGAVYLRYSKPRDRWIAIEHVVYGENPRLLLMYGDGTLVESFGNAGRITFPFPTSLFFSHDVVEVAADGGLFVLSEPWPPPESGDRRTRYCRWMADGSPALGTSGCEPVDLTLWVHDALPDGSTLAWIEGGHVRLETSPGMVEFHNPVTNRYRMVYDGIDAIHLDADRPERNWRRTGARFGSSGSHPVCGFSDGRGSTYYTIDGDECAALKKARTWTYQGIAFYSTPPEDGGCRYGHVAVYQMRGTRAVAGTSAYRYVVEPNDIASMLSRGWLFDGAVFCARPQEPGGGP